VPATAAESAMGEVVVAETGAGRFAQTIQASGHRLSADEPVSVGGMDSGPTPYDLLLAALGACTSMTLRLYAERKGWSMGPITVRLAHHKIHAADCADCETREGKIDHITRSIELAEPVDAARREALLRIADRCPVHRTLMSEVRVETGLAGS
jgi:putative redox protein